MSRSLNLDVLVRLRDRLSGPMRRLRDNLRSLANVGRQIGVIGTAIAAISFLGPIQEAAAFEQKLLDIAGTAELTGSAAFDFARQARREYEELALATGQLSDTVTTGVGQMIAAGLDQGLVDRNIGMIGRAATAANAEFADMAGVATSLLQTLDVPETELEGALAGLVVAGKEGAFELKDMARYFPQLTGQMKKFGLEGRAASNQIAAMLQIARMGTSDPGAAANNLNNFLAKALAPVTIDNFADMGVDIEAVMMDAVAKGINPLEAMLQKIGKLTGVSESEISKYMEVARDRGLEGAEALGFVREQLEAVGSAGKLGELFGDMQVLDFLLPMLANVEEYKRIRDEVAAATGAVIDADFETQMAGLNRQLNILREIGTQAIREVGFAFGEWLPMINGGLMAALRWLRELDEATGGWVHQALVAAGGGVLLVGAIGALGLALPFVAAGFSALASLAAVAVGPIGLLVAAIGAGAVYIGRNWDRFGPRIMRIWDRVKRGFSDFASGLVDRGREIVRRGRELVDRYGPAVREGIGRAWKWASGAAAAAWAKLPSFDTIKTAGLELLADALERLSRLKKGALAWIETLDLPSFAEIKTAGLESLAGVMDRLRDIRDGGLDFLQSFAGGFRDAFAGADFSGAEAAGSALNVLGAALRRIKSVAEGGVERTVALLQNVWRFLEGVGGKAGAIGEGWGSAVGEMAETIGTLTDIVSDLIKVKDRIMGALPEGLSIDWKRILGDGAEGLGAIFGQGLANYGNAVATLVGGLNDLLAAIREITSAVADGRPIPWENILPAWVIWTGNLIAGAVDWVAKAVGAVAYAFSDLALAWGDLVPDWVSSTANGIASAIDAMASAIRALKEEAADFKWPQLGPPPAPLPNLPGGTPVGDPTKIDPGTGMTDAWKKKMEDNRLRMQQRRQGANSNDQRSSLKPATPSPRQFAAAVAPVRQDVNVGGTVRIAVEGPGKMVGATSDNPRVTMAPDRGRASLGNAA